MDQLKQLVAKLSLRQKISLLVVAGGVMLGLWSLAKWNTERDFRPLYSGLAAEDAGAVIAKLREGGVDYRVADSGASVLVPSAKAAELRLQMAAAGLPKTGRLGFELFDKTNFGITEFTEQVNYRRAVEGELERSVMSLAEVERARVHVTFPKNSVFLEARQPAKASVLLQLKAGARLSPGNVIAISHLVSSAVENLAPEAVSIVDMRGNLLSRPRKTLSDEDAAGEASLDYRQKVERDLLTKINATLEPVLGPEKFRAGVHVECDFTSGEQSEESFDPTRSVMVTAQRTEDISGATASAAGVPGTPSNLPRPAARPSTSGGGVTRRTENISYQTTRTVRKVRLPQGAVKRVSVALLVDHTVRWEGSGSSAKRVHEPPSPEKLKIIRDLVAGVSGFSAERGDQIIVESLPFEPSFPTDAGPNSGPAAQPPPGSPLWKWIESNPKTLMWAGAGAGAVLLLGGLAWFFLKRRARKKGGVQMAKGVAGGAAPAAIAGETEDFSKRLQDQLAEQMALKEKQTLEALNSLKIPVHTKKSEVLVKHISEETKKDPAAAAQIIRTWLSESDY